MKIKDTDYAALQTAVLSAMRKTGKTEAQYTAQGLTAMRYRWDMLWASGFPVSSLYRYMNDEHIDAALRRIVTEA